MNELTIKKIESIGDLKELVEVFSLAFETEYTTTDTYLHTMLSNSTALIVGAILDNQIVGGVIAFEMTPVHGTKELYIYDIAVHPKYQRKGIGSKLMEKIRSEAKVRNVGTIFIEAESDDEGAVAFYRALGGEEILVNHFNFKI